MLEAKLLLDNPALSIAEIADELNFSDQSFFGKYFKRLAGMSPKEYRQT
ncbi:MAG: AraC family transcriptional regulator [Bacteroidia bacterium]|nr:AraC family transcriptional regulator [Bacteroidia bacterium]